MPTFLLICFTNKNLVWIWVIFKMAPQNNKKVYLIFWPKD